MKMTYSCTVFLHWMGELVAFGCAAREETILTNIKVETLQATIPVKDNGSY